MEKVYDSPARKGGKSKKLKKIITFFTCAVLIIVSLGIYTLKDFGIGYRYYEQLNNQSVSIGVSQQSNIITQTTEEFLLELEDKGYYVASMELNKDFFVKQALIQKPQINDDEIKNTIKKSIDVEILLTKLTISGDNTVYYFKTDADCTKFVNELNEIKKIESSTESLAGDYHLLTSEEVLQQKIDALKADKKAEEAKVAARKAAAAKVQVTSRGSTETRGSVSSSSECFPLASYSYISSPYGMRRGSMHTGTDFAASKGTNVYAWRSGKVTFAGWSGGYGNFIIVDHGNGLVSRYAHLSGYNCSQGDTVSVGQTIGYVGSTGNSTGPHLHFEIKVNGSFVNPLNYL